MNFGEPSTKHFGAWDNNAFYDGVATTKCRKSLLSIVLPFTAVLLPLLDI